MREDLNRIMRAPIYAKVLNILWVRDLLDGAEEFESNILNERYEDLEDHER